MEIHHLQVPNGTKNGTIGAMSQVEKLGLVDIQNFLERYLMAHLKAIAQMYVLIISFTIRKCHIALKRHFWYHFLSGKAWKYKTVPL